MVEVPGTRNTSASSEVAVVPPSFLLGAQGFSAWTEFPQTCASCLISSIREWRC